MSHVTAAPQTAKTSVTFADPYSTVSLPPGAALVVGPKGNVLLDRRPFPLQQLSTQSLRGRGLDEIEPPAFGQTLHRLWRAFRQDRSFHVSEMALGRNARDPEAQYMLSLGAVAHPDFPDLCVITVRDAQRHNSEVQDLLDTAQALRERCERWEVVTRTTAHDVRSSLSALNGFLQLSLRERAALPASVEKNVVQALQIGRRLLGVLGDLEQTEDPQPMDTERVTVAALGQRLFQALQAAYPDVAFTWHVESADEVSRVPIATAWSVLWNVLTNAVKYRHEERPLHIGLQAWMLDAVVQVEVHDSGRGIPDGEEEAVFDWGHRHAEVDGVPGSGFGLFSARRQLAARGGKIWFEPCYNGARVRISLPAQNSQPSTVEAPN